MILAKMDTWKETVPYQSIILALFCGVAAALLAVTQFYTQPVIAKRIAEDQNALLEQVLAGESFANDVFSEGQNITLDKHVYQIYPVRNQSGALTHHVIRGSQEGYSGPITFLIGVNTKGVITGVRVLSHTETPGLGDHIELAKSDWILSFNQHSLANTPLWGVKKDGGTFDQFTGATITPRAVVKGVHHALLALAKLEAKEASNE